MNAKHTPGPWLKSPREGSTFVWAGGDGIDDGVNIVADVFDSHGSKSSEEAIANARLIATAPDLLDALHDTAVALAAILAQPQDETRRPHAQHYLERAREVLAKAGGAA